MEIVVGKTAGFCYGVKNAVDKSEEELKNGNRICCLGEIVHNSKVVKNLEEKGIKFIDSLEENTKRDKTIIRAHGVSKSVYELAEKMGIELVDLTCPNVLKIHKIVSEHEKNGYFIMVVGNKNHPETLGTIGFCGKNYCVIESDIEIKEAVRKFKESNKQNLLVIVQTTFGLEKFNKYIEIIKEEINDKQKNIKICNSICNATRIRQEETEKISKEVDYMIIIGGKNSSNTKKLYEIANKNCSKVVCIEGTDEINKQTLQHVNKVGIMAGASTPQDSIKEVVDLLKNT